MFEKKGHMGKTISFSSNEDREMFYKDFNSQSMVEKIFSSWKFQSFYNINEIKFKEDIITELLKKNIVKEKKFNKYDNKLEKLHLCLELSNKSLDESEQNKISISFYETSNILNNRYVEFIKNIISPLFDDSIYYQVVPTFRFHFPNQAGYNWNDRYHTDVMLGHPPFEFNIWIPFTDVYESNSMRLASYEDSIELIGQCNDDFEILAEKAQYDDSFIKKLQDRSKSLKMNYGEFIIFDPRCLHCTQYNDTKDTRISMDIRIIMKSELKKYSRTYKTTGRKKMPFVPGHYFSNEAV